MTGHAGHHLMDATAKYYKIDLTGKVLENHRVQVVPPNDGHSLISQDNTCWEVNKGLQTQRIQSLF